MVEIQAHLDRLAALDGVHGSFLFDRQGIIQQQSSSNELPSNIRILLARIFAQTINHLSDIQAAKSTDIDMFLNDSRILIKNISHQGICIICDRQVNNSLLNIMLNECIRTLSGDEPPPSHDVDQDVIENLKQIAIEVLGEHASKVINVLENAESDEESLLNAITQAEKLTRMFIDKDQAGQMAQRMRDLIQGPG
jgi:hypothetical protein